jgi:small subunit ribosomal protein S2
MEEVMTKETELNNETSAAPQKPANMPLLEEMMKAGLFIGRKNSKTHPRMKKFIFGTRSHSSVIDLEETATLLESAMEFAKNKVAAKGTVLLVGTTPAAKKSVEETAKRLQAPYVTERWLGGTLTNFKTLSKRVAYFKKLKSDRQAGRLDKYTKKERLDFDRKIAKMTVMFSGLEEMQGLPDVLLVIDVNSNMTAVREAKKLHIPVVGLLNTDTDPELVTHPIPANDRSKASIDWVLGQFEKAVEEGKAAQVKAAGEKLN